MMNKRALAASGFCALVMSCAGVATSTPEPTASLHEGLLSPTDSTIPTVTRTIVPPPTQVPVTPTNFYCGVVSGDEFNEVIKNWESGYWANDPSTNPGARAGGDLVVLAMRLWTECTGSGPIIYTGKTPHEMTEYIWTGSGYKWPWQ